LFGCFGISLLFACNASTSDKDVKLISLPQARQEMLRSADAKSTSLLIIDPRPQAKWQAGHLPGARNITLAEIAPGKQGLSDARTAEMVIVYADDPGSPLGIGTAKRLVQLGVDNVNLLEGGLLGWRLSGGKLETK
jgi:rhodanese-related sulfurtransferase